MQTDQTIHLQIENLRLQKMLCEANSRIVQLEYASICAKLKAAEETAAEIARKEAEARELLEDAQREEV